MRYRAILGVVCAGGYLWFGTAEGLSLFDGYQFMNYTVNDGLPHRVVVDILEFA